MRSACCANHSSGSADLCAFDSETTAGIARLVSSVDNQEDLVEHFKTDNALLHNSLSFFGRFSVQPSVSELDPAISAAAAAILNLTLDTSSARVRDVEDRLSELDRLAGQHGLGNSVQALLAHGRLINQILPSVDNTLRSMRRLPLKHDEDALRKVLLAKQVETRTSARGFRSMLYATSLALVVFLFYLGVRLKAHEEALQRRAAFEHIVTGISMRLISARPETLDAEIDRAVAEMAAFTGADRAYFVTSGVRAAPASVAPARRGAAARVAGAGPRACRSYWQPGRRPHDSLRPANAGRGGQETRCRTRPWRLGVRHWCGK